MKYKILLLAASFCMLALPIKSYALLSEYLFEQTTGEAFDMSNASTAIAANVDDQTVQVNIGFTFNFDGGNYTELTLCSNGWLKLGSYTTNVDYTNAWDGGANYPIIAGFWDDIRTHENGYVKYKTEGPPGSRVMVMEWYTREWITAGTGPWVWQVRLYETTNVIEFYYVDMASNFSSTATIGMATSTSNWLNVIPGTPRASASTTTQYHSWNINVSPIASGTLFRFRRVLDDLACDSVWFNSNNAINSFLKDEPVTVTTRLINLGGNPKNNIPVQFRVFYGNNTSPIYSSEQRIVSPGNRFGTATTTFSPIPGAINRTSGIYTVQVYPTNPVDEERRNDTCNVPYFVLGNRDIVGFKLLQPFANVPPLFTKYPVGEGVPIEARFLNVGTTDELNVPIGYDIYRQGETEPFFSSNSIIQGAFPSATFRDVNLPVWRPDQPGVYCIRVYSQLPEDEARTNDTVPSNSQFCFVAAYPVEVSAIPGGTTQQTSAYPLGRPIYMDALFQNTGLTDATNTQATMYVYDPSGTEVYRQSVQVQDIVADGGRTLQRFPDFTPPISSGSGRYCVGVRINHPDDPVKSNDSISFCFNVLSPLSGPILVGRSQRFLTIEEARDSLFYLGISGDVEFLLVDDEYTVSPSKGGDEMSPALDFRGTIIGSGENARITWRPHPNKTQVTIHLQSPSGMGMWFGQNGTDNPSGYMTFDGGPNRALRVELENTGVHDLYVPFYFGAGSSNYTVKNVEIAPYGGGDLHCTQTLSIPRYDQSFNQFTYVDDLAQEVSAGIMLRNRMPYDPSSGGNSLNADTLYNQNNVFEGNHIMGFGYGIASVGAGPIMREQDARFEAVNNRGNIYRGNMIEDVSRAGIVVSFETGSQIVENRIEGVHNTCTGAGTAGNHAAGIWVSAGGNASGNRGFSNDLLIARNQVSDVRASQGNGAGIWIENNRNLLITPGGVVQEMPTSSAMDVQNNMTWDYSGAKWASGVALTVATDNAGLDYTPRDNDVINNTIYNPAASGNGSNGAEYYGIVSHYSEADIYNNLIAVLNSGAAAVGYVVRTPQYEPYNMSVESDYNLFWVPNGVVGELERVSPEGFHLPSPPVADNLSQWRYLTHLDENSLVGNILPEFMDLTPGSEDLHLNPQLRRSLAGNRGTKLAELMNDIDLEPRSQAAINGQYDIGADEFWGVVQNNDLVAEGVSAPFGWRASTGTFSDAEYVMDDSLIDLRVKVRNIGGRPMAGASVNLEIDYWNGSTWINEASISRMAAVDMGEATEVDFGQYQPRTMWELGLTNATFGTMAPNVTPIYRFVVTVGNDDNLGNNRYEKQVRFYVQRSKTESFVSVENYMPGVDGSTLPTSTTSDLDRLGNKLNADSILSALAQINWSRSGTVGGNTDFTYDLFERDRWPQYALNFAPWQFVMWMQGEEAEGLKPEERWAIKDQQDAWDEWRRAGLFITGQEISRTHDVVLDAFNGERADREFVQEYLRAQHVRNTSPELYDGRRVQGIRITNRRFETVEATGVKGDRGPRPTVVRATNGEGVAQGTHWYVEENMPRPSHDSLSGMTVADLTRASVFYAIDIRHWGRFEPEADRSGVQRVVLGAIDFLDQYSAVLPVEVLSFNAHQTGRESVTVSWETVSEKEISGLEIERSEVLRSEAGESLGASQVIAQRVPEGGPDKTASYQVLDETVRMGTEYEYRLISVEKDGRRVVAATSRVLVTGGAESSYALSVYPNPVQTTGVISWRIPRGETAVLTIVDEQGKVVRNEEMTSSGEGELRVDASNLPSGTYWIKLTSGMQVLTQPMTIQK